MARKFGQIVGRGRRTWLVRVCAAWDFSPSCSLAKPAVGLAVDLVTNWTCQSGRYAYLSCEGNSGTKESITLRNLPTDVCPHFPDAEVGDPVLLDL